MNATSLYYRARADQRAILAAGGPAPQHRTIFDAAVRELDLADMMRRDSGLGFFPIGLFALLIGIAATMLTVRYGLHAEQKAEEEGDKVLEVGTWTTAGLTIAAGILGVIWLGRKML